MRAGGDGGNNLKSVPGPKLQMRVLQASGPASAEMDRRQS